MKFSILIPTRNRLEYLKLAVESVARQDYEDWQLVVSDNRSEQDIEGYLSTLGDSRIVYSRTDRVLPVTENWNRALSLSSGDYVIMLGDDDALLGGYLGHMEELIREFEEPDVLYTKALLFTYPAVDPAYPRGFVMDLGCAEFFSGAARPFLLDRERALRAVEGAMEFRLRYDFNAQFLLISRSLIESVRDYGDFYQSAFPDYYSTNAAFLRARRVVIDPNPRVVIGVTPKSYGYFHVNEKESEGRAFLDGAPAADSVGTNINVGWLSAVTALERGVGAEFGMRVNHRRYRFVQAAYVYKRYRAGIGSRAEVNELERQLPFLERMIYRGSDRALRLVHRILPKRLQAALVHLLVHRLVGQLPHVPPTMLEGRYRNVLEVFEDRGVAHSAVSAPQGG